MAQAKADKKTLCIDIGGTGLKMEVVNGKGEPVTQRARVETPHPASPKAVLDTLAAMINSHADFDRVSAGFPGVVVGGITKTAPNLDRGWRGFNLGKALEELTGKPTRVSNDADVQGFGDIEGKGLEMVITLGTGVGSAVYIDGKLLPNLELGHQPFEKGKTYEDYLGKAALDKVGPKRWRKRVSRVIEQLEPIWNYRALYVGGGNAKLLNKADLPGNVHVAPNEAGLLGGVALWR